MIRTFVVALLLSVVACGGGHAARRGYDYAKELDPRRSEYVVGVPDHLNIHVWNNPELSRDVIVRPDGTITLPLLGDVTAEGRTPSQIREEIAAGVAKYVRGEGVVVTVTVTAVNSYSFTVSGNVERAGVFSAQKYTTVLEALQLAGGPNRFAAVHDVKLMRRDAAGRLRVIPIDYPAVLDGSIPEANLALLRGDQLHVP